MTFKKQIYTQIDAGLYNLLQQYKQQTNKTMREIIEEAFKLLFANLGIEKPLRGTALIKHANKYLEPQLQVRANKEDIVSKIDDIVYRS